MIRNILMVSTLIAVTGVMSPITSLAQSTAGLNPVYRRAQGMVNDGNAAAGRALIDSMVGVAGPGTNEYAEAVYWRAVLAATAAEAELDYRRIVVDHPQSARVEDALLRLAQLEMSRASYDGALRHLNRLVLEHPNGASRPRAGYWMARVFFEKNDIQRACAANADALARTGENDAELRNQITYLNQRCAGVVLATAEPANVAVTSAPPTPPVSDSAVRGGAAGIAISPAPTSTVPARSVPAEPVVEPPSPATRDTATRRVDPTVSPSRSAATSSRPAATGAGFSVQVAAYNVKSQATAMVTKLKKSGYEARVSGTKAPFRVRVGHYETHSQAAAVQRSLKAKQITGFVVQAETQ